MIATYAFVAVWVAAGVGVLLTALLKGRRSKGGPTAPASRNRMILTFGFLYVVIGLAVPALSIADSYNNDIVRGEGIQLTSDQMEGRQLFGQLCGSCHRLGSANAEGRVGPNLDIQLTPVPAADDAEARKNFEGRYDYVHTTIINGINRGNGNMPALVAQGKQAQQIASFVAATAGYKNPTE